MGLIICMLFPLCRWMIWDLKVWLLQHFPSPATRILAVVIYVLRFACVHGLGSKRGGPFANSQLPHASIDRIIFRASFDSSLSESRWYCTRCFANSTCSSELTTRFALTSCVVFLRQKIHEAFLMGPSPSMQILIVFERWQPTSTSCLVTSSTPLSNFAISSYVASCLQFSLFPNVP